MIWRRVSSLLLALVLALLLAGTAEAHANIVRSEPAAGALLETAPRELVLEFSEELDPSFSAVQLFNGTNQMVSAGPGVIDPVAPRVLRLALEDLPKDSYTAVWKVRSAADGHITRGSVPFGVGVAVNATSLIPPPGAPDPATLPPALLDSVARWLNLLMAAVALGGVPFILFVWRPACGAARRAAEPGQASGPDANGAQDAAMTRAIQRLILVGGGLFLLTNLLFLLTQAAAAADVSLAQAIGSPARQLLSGRSGLLWLARIALLLQIGVISWRLRPISQGQTWRWWIVLAISAIILLTFSLNSHAAAQEGAALGVLADWVHIAAMVAWLGGLIPLAMAVRARQRTPDQSPSLAALIPSFSRLAAICVALLTITGIYSYILQIDGLDLLAATTYGRALLVKLGLFALLLLLGGLNLFILSPRLRMTGGRLARAFTRSVRAELVVGALLLLAVGAMTSVAPSKTAWEEHEQQGISQQAEQDGVQLVLRIAPAQVGDNEFAVDVTDSRPGAQSAPAKVLLRFNMVGMEMGTLQADTTTTDTRRYTARGSFTTMGGRWQIEVILRRAGFDDVQHVFDVDILREVTPG